MPGIAQIKQGCAIALLCCGLVGFGCSSGAPGSAGVVGADGRPGSTGAAGAPGAAGTAGLAYVGTVVDASGGAPPAGTPVVISSVDTNGQVLSTLGAGVTDGEGNYSVVAAGVVAPSTGLLAQAFLEQRTLSAFATEANLRIDPVSDGVFQIIDDIVRTPQGRSVADFSNAEVAELTNASATALQAANVDLADPQAIQSHLLHDVGLAFASASGGTASATEGGRVQVPAPAGVLAPSGSYYLNLTDQGGELWDTEGDGSVDDGTDDSYDTMFVLTVSGTDFSSQSGPTDQLEDGVQRVLGPQLDLGGTGLAVTRKIFVPADQPFARFAEILSNPTAADVTVDVQLSGNLGSDEGTDEVDASSDGNTTVDASDFWLANHKDSSDPALGFLFPGATGDKNDDDIGYTWTGVTVPAGKTVTLLSWAYQRSDGDLSRIISTLQQVGRFPPASYYQELTSAEIDACANAGVALNVVGEAGSAVPGEVLTLTNSRTLATATVSAASDGSFQAALVAAAGDTVSVTGTGGSSLSLVVP